MVFIIIFLCNTWAIQTNDGHCQRKKKRDIRWLFQKFLSICHQCSLCINNVCYFDIELFTKFYLESKTNRFNAFVFIGILLQLGIAIITGGGIYVIRVIENFIIMTIITIFAFSSFDCDYCVDSKQRQAWSPLNDDGNIRILVWIFSGWFAIIIHLITSLLMTKIVDDQYKLNIAAGIEQYWKKFKEQQKREAETQQEEVGSYHKLKMENKNKIYE